MFNISHPNSQLNPIQKLRIGQDTPEEQFLVIVSEEEIEELVEYVKEVTYDLEKVYSKIKKVLLLYLASVRFIILSFDNDDDNLPEKLELLENFEHLCKNLYLVYNNANVILLSREISTAYKTYSKLSKMENRLPSGSQRKLISCKDRLITGLNSISVRVKSL